MPRKVISPEERFLAKVERQPNGCLYWTASLFNTTGYGVFHPSKKEMTTAHRWAFIHWIRPLVSGEVVDHECHNRDKDCMGGKSCQHRRCVELTHLGVTDNDTNLRNSHRYNSNKTHCPVGHEYSEDNTYIDPDGIGRRCRECARELDRQPHRNAALRRRIKAQKGAGSIV